MSTSITPALQPIVLPPPSPVAVAGQRRADTFARNDTVLEAAGEAIVTKAEEGTPTTGQAPEVAATVKTGQGTATVQVWDVNGDGAKDAVVRDTTTGASTALINRGENDAPVFDDQTVALTAPTMKDLDTLAVEGPRTGREFLAADTDGDGLRQIAVKRGAEDWISLGGRQDVAGQSPTAAIEDAEARFERIMMELSELLYTFAWARSFSRLLGQRMSVSVASPLYADYGQHALNGYDTDIRGLGLTLLSDPFLSVVAAFAPADWGADDSSDSLLDGEEGGGDRKASATPGEAKSTVQSALV